MMTDLGPIDFARASLAWTTRNGSHGRWHVIASALRQGATPNEHERFVLAPAVMAGDVYGTGRLVLDPPYSFQIIASNARHAIMRTYVDGTPARDTRAPNSDIFSELRIKTPPLAAERIDQARLTTAGIARAWPLTARLHAKDRDGIEWLLEFPVQHINTARMEGIDVFQVETGPILVPASLLSRPGAANATGFATAYIYFNRLDRADLVALGAADANTPGKRDFRVMDRLDGVSIALYGAGTGS